MKEHKDSFCRTFRNDSGRIWMLDGAMGTMIQSFSLGEDDFRGERFKDWDVKLEGNNDIVSLTRPDVIRQIHRAYLEAGADIIETNTFNAQRISQADYHTGHIVGEMNRAAIRIAREEADRMTRLTPEKPRFVAASIGPTNRTLSMSPDVENPAYRALTFDGLRDAYREQMAVLAEGGADIWLIETIFDTLNAKAALDAARMIRQETGRHIPVMLSVTITDASGRTLSGQTLDAFLTSVGHSDDIFSVGLNCSFGAEDMRPYLQALAECSPYYISAYPNAGFPDEEGKYNQTPQMMAQAISAFADDRTVNIVGGCCGSTPEHIRAIAAAISGKAARPLPAHVKTGWLAGLESFSPAKGMFINVGERCNVAGSRKFLRLIKEKQYDEALAIARKQVRDGAAILDINMDDGLLDTEHEMVGFLNLMASDPEVARIPWMIDSSRFSVVEAALKCMQGKAIVNSISLKEGEESFIEKAQTIREYGAAMVVMAFDEEGQATTYERKIQVCQRAYRLLTEKAGIKPTDIIFDPNILTVATGMKEHDRYALDFIRATVWIRKNLPGAHVSGGVSNLSFAFRGNNYLREAMHAAFLYNAIKAGMDMGIVNPATKVMYQDIPADLLEAIEDVILCRKDNATDKLAAMAQKLLEEKDKDNATDSAASTADRSGRPVEERLAEALRTGDSEYLTADIHEALEKYPAPADIIEGPLMKGMQTVGDLFGEGKMFLPQVVKSARTMKQAVAILKPYIEENRSCGNGSNGKYVVATVKGDVHDIGKNIVAVVLGCNNFSVIDLGVMTPAEKIIQTVKEENADFVALSGLITPSLDEMCKTAEAMAKAGISVPLFIGGATTSELHTAIKIAPLYKGPVFHMKDAAQNPVVALQLLGPDRDAIIEQNRKRQEELARQHSAARKVDGIMKLADGKAGQTSGAPNRNTTQDSASGRLEIDWDSQALPRPAYIGYRTISRIRISEIRKYINWIYFFNLWKVRKGQAEAESIKQEAELMLNEMEKRHYMQAQVGFYPAYSTSRSIILPGAVNGNDLEIPTPRQRHPNAKGDACLSLCDFIAPRGYSDFVGVFAITVSPSYAEELETAKSGTDTYRTLMMQSLGDRLAEATSEWLHRKVRKELWGYAPDENLSMKELAKAMYRGIRPAVGYPSLPDQKLIFPISRLLDFKTLNIRLTENGAMYPQSSVCGLYMSNREARYFAVGRTIDNEHGEQNPANPTE